MKIIVSQQQNKRIKITFQQSDIVDSYEVDKAEEFLVCVDKLLKKRHTIKVSDFRDAELEFHNTGILTERVIKSIILGLSFSKN